MSSPLRVNVASSESKPLLGENEQTAATDINGFFSNPAVLLPVSFFDGLSWSCGNWMKSAFRSSLISSCCFSPWILLELLSLLSICLLALGVSVLPTYFVAVDALLSLSGGGWVSDWRVWVIWVAGGLVLFLALFIAVFGGSISSLTWWIPGGRCLRLGLPELLRLREEAHAAARDGETARLVSNVEPDGETETAPAREDEVTIVIHSLDQFRCQFGGILTFLLHSTLRLLLFLLSCLFPPLLLPLFFTFTSLLSVFQLKTTSSSPVQDSFRWIFRNFSASFGFGLGRLLWFFLPIPLLQLVAILIGGDVGACGLVLDSERRLTETERTRANWSFLRNRIETDVRSDRTRSRAFDGPPVELPTEPVAAEVEEEEGEETDAAVPEPRSTSIAEYDGDDDEEDDVVVSALPSTATIPRNLLLGSISKHFMLIRELITGQTEGDLADLNSDEKWGATTFSFILAEPPSRQNRIIASLAAAHFDLNYPMFEAAEKGHFDVTKRLIRHGADPNFVRPSDGSNDTVMHILARQTPESVPLLLWIFNKRRTKGPFDPRIENTAGEKVIDMVFDDEALLLRLERMVRRVERKKKREKKARASRRRNRRLNQEEMDPSKKPPRPPGRPPKRSRERGEDRPPRPKRRPTKRRETGTGTDPSSPASAPPSSSTTEPPVSPIVEMLRTGTTPPRADSPRLRTSVIRDLHEDFFADQEKKRQERALFREVTHERRAKEKAEAQAQAAEIETILTAHEERRNSERLSAPPDFASHGRTTTFDFFDDLSEEDRAAIVGLTNAPDVMEENEELDRVREEQERQMAELRLMEAWMEQGADEMENEFREGEGQESAKAASRSFEMDRTTANEGLEAGIKRVFPSRSINVGGLSARQRLAQEVQQRAIEEEEDRLRRSQEDY